MLPKSSNLNRVDGPIQAPPVFPLVKRGRLRCLKQLVLVLITIIAALRAHPHFLAQEVTQKTPPSAGYQSPTQLPAAPQAQNASGTPDLDTLPRATVIGTGKPVPQSSTDADSLTVQGSIKMLSGHVVVHYEGRTFQADTISYDEETGDITANGHLRLSGGTNGEYLEASHGTYNIKTELGRFYDVSGSVGLHALTQGSYSNANPVLFSGRMVVKTGPENYEIYEGAVTSCLLPRPDWQLISKQFSLNGEEARAKNSTFKLLGVSVLFLPYVTHPIDAQKRQSGLLIPVISQSSTKGFVFGESAYFALGRSADLTAGMEYFSSRGFSESGTFRYRGVGDEFFNAHFTALQDRGFIDSTTGLYTNQGGQDVTASFRRQLTPTMRAVGDAEYLSSYVYREAFTENFNQAVSSDINSTAYVVRQDDGYSVDARVDRYQGLKRVPIGTIPGQQVRIFHAPSVDFDAVDHRIANSPFFWSLTGSAAGLKRSQPNFTSSGIVERVDIEPELSLPLSGGGWHTMSSVAVRETFYSRSRQAQGVVPIESTNSLNRAAVDLNIHIDPPTMERTFEIPRSMQHLFGTEVRHTIEPEITYRNVHGVNSFLNTLRFDDVDLYSDTDELEYGVTQHLYFKTAAQKPQPLPPGCPAQPGQVGYDTQTALDSGAAPPEDPTPDVLDPTADSSTDANGIPSASATAPDVPLQSHARHHDPCARVTIPYQQTEWFSWKLAQRHFFDPTFGGAVTNSRRNIFDTTLSLSGVAFLTEPRSISPLVSRMRFRTSSHTDVEWDFDLDTGAKKFTSSNIFIDAHEGPVFGGVSFAQLNAPGRFYTENIDSNGVAKLVGSPTSSFSQMRMLLGYGMPTKPGLSAAANAGIDLNLGSLQYGSVQASYNWNCCGLSVEYRKYELGSVRNEGVERFNFTLVNIGTAGNLRRAERLF